MAPRLKQVPMFLPPDLAPSVTALPVELRAVAHGLHQLVVDDGRTWLEVTAAAAEEEDGVQLEHVLDGDRRRRPRDARHRAWWEIHKGTGGRWTHAEIGKAFGGVHHTTIAAAVEKYSARQAATAAALAAVERYQAAEDRAA